MSVNKIGDWERARNVISHLAQDMSAALKESLPVVALKAERIAVLHVRNQDLNWQGLKDATLKQKSKKGWSNKIMIATTDYISSITSYATHDTAFAGVKKDAKNRDGESLVSIAAVMEFGHATTPARPLWGPTYKETLAWMKKEKIFSKTALAKMRNR